MSGDNVALLEVADLSVTLGRPGTLVVDGVNLSLHAGERIALLGPSGCGKTTTLRAIAGFEQAAKGTISLGSRTLSRSATHVPPEQREMGMVFQEFALFPHLTVDENLAFGLQRRARRERTTRIEELLALVGMTGFSTRYPGELSGGQQQRVALARALAPGPKLLLLDEPFSSLDAALRRTTREHTANVLTAVGAAAILVTHDQDEAMSFAERLFVMRAGRVEQSGTPEQVYRTPKNAYVATFLGSANLLDGEAQGEVAMTPVGEVPLATPHHGPVRLCVRPESLHLSAEGPVRGEIRAREFRGPSVHFEVTCAGTHVEVLASGEAPWRVGDPVALDVISAAAVLAGD